MSNYQVRFNQIYSSSIPIQVGTTRILSGVTAEPLRQHRPAELEGGALK